MPSTIITGIEALRRRKANAEAAWPAEGAAQGRVRPLALARVDSPFKINAGASIGAVGDAFAHQLAAALGRLGHPLPADERFAPRAADDPAPAAPARALTPHTIDAALARALAPAPPVGEDGPEDESAARARRRRDWAFGASASADLVILLPQSVEAWRDKAADAWIDSPPPGALEQNPSGFSLHLADADDVYQALDSACARICEARDRRGAPPAQFAVGVSPAPIAETFTGGDILTADEHAKAALLTAVCALAEAREDTAYLPVYETVRRSALHTAFEPDGRTVRPAMMRVLAGRILGALVRPRAPSETAAAPERADLMAGRGRALTGRFYDDAAADALQNAVRGSPDAFGAHMRLARLLLRGGRAGDAAETLRDATAAARGTTALAGAQHELGLAESRAGRAAEAETALRAAGDLRPADAAVRLDLGRALLAQGRPAEAEAELRRACDLAPEDSAPHLELGCVLLERGDPAAAALPLARAAQLAPAEAASHHKLGQALLAHNRHAEALAALRRAAELDPRYAEG